MALWNIHLDLTQKEQLKTIRENLSREAYYFAVAYRNSDLTVMKIRIITMRAVLTDGLEKFRRLA